MPQMDLIGKEPNADALRKRFQEVLVWFRRPNTMDKHSHP